MGPPENPEDQFNTWSTCDWNVEEEGGLDDAEWAKIKGPLAKCARKMASIDPMKRGTAKSNLDDMSALAFLLSKPNDPK